MTDSSSAPPPPYRTHTPPTERGISPVAPITVSSSSNLEGKRNSILDNAPVLFVLGHQGSKQVPQNFNVVTVKAPPRSTSMVPGLIHACLMYCEHQYKGKYEARLFVQGPQRDTMEDALAALLEKTQEMLGTRWQLPLSLPGNMQPYVYLER